MFVVVIVYLGHTKLLCGYSLLLGVPSSLVWDLRGLWMQMRLSAALEAISTSTAALK